MLNEASFREWAIKEKLVKPDNDRIKDRLKDMVEKKADVPSCVALTTKDSISIKKAKE